jgi:predicted nucleic acid-binding protein
MKVLLDTNVVLDLMLERDPWRAEAEAIAQASADGHLHAHVCASSITDIFYGSSGNRVGGFQSFGSMQVRIFRRKYSSSR